MPSLISGSGDSWIKIWKYDSQNKRIFEAFKKKAHQKAVRDVQWKHTYLVEADKYIISCSEVLQSAFRTGQSRYGELRCSRIKSATWSSKKLEISKALSIELISTF